MRPIISTLLFVFLITPAFSQYNYEPSSEHPFGLPNPSAGGQITDYQAMIGICDCKSTSRKQDGTWADSVDMTWEFKYILNGMAVQDMTLKADGSHSGSIRQFSADSSKWFVHYYSSNSPSPQLSSWAGGNIDDKVVLYRKQPAPNGTEGFYRLTFYDMSASGYHWIGEWVNVDESIVYPTWKIDCARDPK